MYRPAEVLSLRLGDATALRLRVPAGLPIVRDGGGHSLRLDLDSALLGVLL